jgi:hypothetical protein
MKTKIKLKNQKPIDIDVHFKYRCPKLDCGYDHWLSLKESKTPEFKIVCDCGHVFKTKRVAKIKIVYEKTKPLIKKDESLETSKVIEKSKAPVDLKDSCVKLLVSYGFTKNESSFLCDKAFEKNPESNPGLLIKYILKNLEELNVND